MRILYCSQYFPPEIGAPAARAQEMVRHLSAAGHEVTVLTAFPNYPSGKIQEDYAGALLRRETLDGARVLRSFVWTGPRKSFVTRLGNYLSFALSSLLAGLMHCRGRFDVVVGSSPPLFVAAIAWLLARRLRARFVFDVRDVWPEAAVALGELSNSALRRASFALADGLYRRADRIICANPGNRELIAARLTPEAARRARVVSNGTNVELFRALAEEPRTTARRELGFEGDFVVVYAGLHGLMYDWDAVLDAAAALGDEPRIRMVLVGDGPLKAEIIECARSRRLANIRFDPPLPAPRAARLIAAADLGMLSMHDLDFFRHTVPVKLYDYMACGLPVVHSAGGFARQLTKRHRVGLCFDPGDGAGLAAAIRELWRRRAELPAIGARGRELVVRRFDRRQLARQFEAELQAAGGARDRGDR